MFFSHSARHFFMTGNMPSGEQQPLIQKFIDKFSNSRDFVISLVLHVILIFLFGTTVFFKAVQEPPDFEGEPGSFVQGSPEVSSPPPPPSQTPPTPNIAMEAMSAPSSSISAITTEAPSPVDFTMPQTMPVPMPMTNPTAVQMAAPVPAGKSGGLTGAQASDIRGFTKGWAKGAGSGSGSGSGTGNGLRQREFEFIAYIGQYEGGNWSSTISTVGQNGYNGGEINNGSLPNLLYFINAFSKNKVKTNYKNVKAIHLDSKEIFAIKPPFLFLTGTKDFKLTEKEVETLQEYVRFGGAIWGDSSVPGRNSRFDIAFRREMRRVIRDVDKDWEPLPPNHPIFTQTYFDEIKDVPAGLNYYREPIYALKIYGEVAIIYTANDYGDMWQIGLNDQGQVDLRRNQEMRGWPWVAMNRNIWVARETYMRNISAQSLLPTYKFGTNIVIHLLTRWELKLRSAPSL